MKNSQQSKLTILATLSVAALIITSVLKFCIPSANLQ